MMLEKTIMVETETDVFNLGIHLKKMNPGMQFIPCTIPKDGTRGVIAFRPKPGFAMNDNRDEMSIYIAYRFADPIKKEILVNARNVDQTIKDCMENGLPICDDPQKLLFGFVDHKESKYYKIRASDLCAYVDKKTRKKLLDYREKKMKISDKQSQRMVCAIGV